MRSGRKTTHEITIVLEEWNEVSKMQAILAAVRNDPEVHSKDVQNFAAEMATQITQQWQLRGRS